MKRQEQRKGGEWEGWEENNRLQRKRRDTIRGGGGGGGGGGGEVKWIKNRCD